MSDDIDLSGLPTQFQKRWAAGEPFGHMLPDVFAEGIDTPAQAIYRALYVDYLRNTRALAVALGALERSRTKAAMAFQLAHSDADTTRLCEILDLLDNAIREIKEMGDG